MAELRKVVDQVVYHLAILQIRKQGVKRVLELVAVHGQQTSEGRGIKAQCQRQVMSGAVVRVSGVVCAFVFAAVCWNTPVARAQAVPPAVHAYPALYSLVGGQWRKTDVLHLGDRAKFVMRFYPPLREWNLPSGRLVVQRRQTPQYAAPTIYRAKLVREHTPKGYILFSITARVSGVRWLGQLVAEYKLRNAGGQTIESDLLFKVVSR